MGVEVLGIRCIEWLGYVLAWILLAMDLMNLHKNVALTISQRKQIQRLYATGQFSYPKLRTQFNTTVATIRKWVKRHDCHDHSSAPKKHHRRVNDAYQQAVVDYRMPIPGMAPFALSANCGLSMALLPSVRCDSFRPKPAPRPRNVRWWIGWQQVATAPKCMSSNRPPSKVIPASSTRFLLFI